MRSFLEYIFKEHLYEKCYCNNLLLVQFVNHINMIKYRKQIPEVFCKKGVLENFAKFTGKHLCQTLLHRCFPMSLRKLLEHLFL